MPHTQLPAIVPVSYLRYKILHRHPKLSAMKTVIPVLGFILAVLVADARLSDAPRRYRVDSEEERSGMHQYFRSRVDADRILAVDLLSMSMSGECATLKKKACVRGGRSCAWDGSTCTEAVEVLPTYSPTESWPTYSPTDMGADMSMSKSGCELHPKKKPCVKGGCAWDGGVCSDRKRVLRAN